MPIDTPFLHTLSHIFLYIAIRNFLKKIHFFKIFVVGFYFQITILRFWHRICALSSFFAEKTHAFSKKTYCFPSLKML